VHRAAGSSRSGTGVKGRMMAESRISENTEARAAAARLFDRAPPVLVEVRFPNMATSPDWHLLDDEEEFDALWERLGPQVELYLSSVCDLRNAHGAVRMTQGSLAGYSSPAIHIDEYRVT